MKTSNSIFFILILCTVFLGSSCKKDKLTKETQTGANTFSCKVDGTTYIAQIQGVSFSGAKPITVSNYSGGSIPNNGWFEISTIDSRLDESVAKLISIRLGYLQSNGKYLLGSVASNFGVYELNYSQAPNYVTNGNNTGEVNITRCDTINRIYSGTFFFTAIDANTGKVVSVTDGRFDVKQ
jgi:hypothetical protein